jgi:WD40-like Beta Propeller Repeat
MKALLIALLAAAAGTVEPWTPGGVSSELFESHPAFDPITGDFYFVRSSKQFSGWRILQTRCASGEWGAPREVAFAGPGVEADPFFTPDGRSLYFISTRATGSSSSRDLDIWRADRAADDTWKAPIRMPAPVNSDQGEWFPRLAADGWLYFGSNRTGGVGKNDIWRAREATPGKWVVENLGRAINTAADEYEPLLSPDGERLIVAAGDGLYESRRVGGRWSRRVRLQSNVNANGTEIGPLFSPSGKSMLFARDTGEPKSGEFFVWRSEGHEAWPMRCGAAQVAAGGSYSRW